MSLLKIKKYILEKYNLDAILITSKENKIYLGMPIGSGIKILLTNHENYILFDGRYLNEVNEKKDLNYEKICFNQGEDYTEHILKIIKKNSKLGIEAKNLNIFEYNKLSNKFDLSLLNNEFLEIRAIKTEEEIDKIKDAIDLTDDIFYKVLNKINVGMTEHDISAYINYYATKNGASSMAFDTIVVSGVRTCMPHGRPTNKIIEKNEIVTIDFGITYNGYQSDMTRNICFGKPHSSHYNIFKIVKDVQEKGTKYIKEGIVSSELDSYVRNLIKEYGYDKYFTHGLGHGLGIGGGELPLINSYSNLILKENMVITCEPGIYIPKLFGIRIEDNVLVRKENSLVLNKTTKDLIIL